MNLLQFLKLVAPKGNLVVARKEDRIANGRSFSVFKHLVRQSHEAAVETVRAMAAGQHDIYYALAAFERGFHRNAKGRKVVRVRENVRALKALWLDIDHKSGLSTTEEVVRAVAAFCKASQLPRPTVIVNSGHGEHIYWALDREVGLDEWQGLADGLKEAAAAYGLQADLACTGDACRVLRPPGTKNWKNPASPKPVTFVYTSDTTYSPEQLGLSNLTPALPAHLENHAASYDEFTGGVGVGAFKQEARFSRIAKKCGVLKHVLDTKGKDSSEPEWKSVLQLLKHCEDGPQYVHEVSSGHPSYSEVETEEKWQQRLENDSGPTLCRTFGEWHSDICAGCPFNGKIKSPIQLGQETVKTKSAPEVVLSTWRPCQKGAGMERKVQDPDSGASFWEKVLYRTYSDLEVTRSVVTRHYELRFVSSSGDNAIEVSLPSGHLGNLPKLKEAMASFGVVLRNSETTAFVDLMATWLQKLQEASKVDDVTEKLGWIYSEDEEDKGQIIGFSLPSVSFYANKPPRKGVRVGRDFQAVGRLYEPHGTLDKWRTAATFLAEQNNPAFTAVLASAFASPLLGFTGEKGGIISLVSSDSGVGKTSAMRCAQAVWGHPVSAMNSVDDTRLSVARKATFINNLPTYWDEVRGNMEEFTVLAFQLSQGREKARLDSSAALRELGSWETLLVAASNESIFDAMGRYAGDTDAGMARCFELTVEPFDTELSRADISLMFGELKDNYGHAGVEYAKFLAENSEWARGRVQHYLVELTNKLNTRASERLWVATVASLMAGAEAAAKAGLVSIDRQRLLPYLVQNLMALRARSTDTMSGTSPAELLAAYMRDMQAETMIVKRLPRGRQNATNFTPEVISAPKHESLRVIVGRDDGLVRSTAADMDAWLRRRGVSKDRLLAAAKAGGLHIHKRRCALILGLDKYTSPRVMTYEWPADLADAIQGGSERPDDTSDSSSD